MWKSIVNWAQERSRRRAAIKLAVQHFEAIKGVQSHLGKGAVLAKTGDRYIVRVCYGHTKPPRRDWFLVPKDGASIVALTFEEVRPYGEKTWL